MAKNYRASLRKSGASGKKKALIFQSARTPALRHNEGAPLSTSSQPCNSTALAPRSSRFPYMTYLLRAFAPMAGVAQRLCSRFGHFLALTVPSAVGLPLFLLCCVLTEIRLYNTQPHDITELKLCNSFQILVLFFRKVSYFAKETASPVFMRVCGHLFSK